MIDPSTSVSPRWSSTTKLVVALSGVGVAAFLLIQFHNLIGPLLLAFILAYLLYPLAGGFQRLTRISWGVGVTLIFLVLVLALLGLVVWGGFALIEQVQNLINFITKTVNELPDFITQISSKPLQVGPFTFDTANQDLTALANQALGLVQPLLNSLGTLVGSLATGAAAVVGWLVFILFLSYFILAETHGEPGRLMTFHVPGYEADLSRMTRALGSIWNAFLRGQLIIFVFTVLVYTALLGVLGVRFFFGLAIIAGLARFLPYVGPGIAWLTYGLVCYFQGSTIFNLTPIAYALMVVGIALVLDNIIDSLIMPRFMGNALKVHPAAVMVAVLVGANLFGLVGVLLAAPVFATVKFFFEYAGRKLFDQDPWEGMQFMTPEPKPTPLIKSFQLIWWRLRRTKKG